MSSTILMAVSAFNGRNHPRMETGDTFQGKGRDGRDITVADCKSQGESVVRYFLNSIPPEDEVHLLMLCTRKTLERDERNGGDDKGHVHSAVSYLRERLETSPERGSRQMHYHVIKLYKNQLPKDHRLQEPELPDPALPLDPAAREEEIYFPEDEIGAISQAAEFIRRQREKDKRSFRLYIDTHGGLRDVVMALNAVISLLSVGEAIKPRMISGINMASQRIEDQSAAFNMFNFFSGMNDFLHFGNANVLSEYFDTKNAFSYLTGAEPQMQQTAQRIVKHMNKISLGAQMSDPRPFLEGLRELGKEFGLGKGRHKADKLKGTSLGIFEQKIIDEYGNLLTNPNILDLVAWCVKHGLMQQALTFMESMLPYYYRDKGLLYFDKEALKDFGEDEYIAFNRYLNKFHFEYQGREEELAFYAYHMVEKTREQEVAWRRLKNGTLRRYHPAKAAMGEILWVKSKWIWEDDYGNIQVEDFRSKVVPLLQRHRVLKITRNVFNHGNSDYRVSLSKLQRFILEYMDALKKAENPRAGGSVSP